MAYRDGHKYGGTTVRDSANAHFGDAHHHHYHQEGPREDQYDTLFRSLSFDGMDTRLRNVEMAISQTCEWVRSDTRFNAWTDHSRVSEHHGIFWLKGKPGSGKSTIMKETLEWAKREWADQLVLSYFFNARAPRELERSCLGLYRSLTHQLLTRNEHIRPLFEAEFSSKEKDGRVEDWMEGELQNFLLQLINAECLPQLNIFIDALDEGDENDVRNMVAFFERAAEYSIKIGSLFRLYLSSRHYPQISIEKGLSIVIENQPGHTHDIQIYIQKNLSGQNSTIIDDIKDTLLRKAGGIFLWVVLSISLLKSLYDRGRVKAMKRKLDDIPSGLYDLFSTIVTKNTEDLDECITLLQWMLVSKGPLDANELYLAIQCQHASVNLDHTESMDDSMAVKYILDCSRGLVELTEGYKSQVQFIHETVRQFLSTIKRDSGQLQHSCFAAFDFRFETCHSVVAEGCLKYLLHVCQKTPLSYATLQQNPLALYAAQYWWQHLQAINGICSEQALSLAVNLLTSSTANLLVWVQIYSIDIIWQRTNFSLIESDLAPPIYYASLIGVPELLTRVMLLNANINTQGGRYGTALQAASVEGHDKIVQILLDHGTDINAQGGRYGTALQAASVKGHEKVVQILLDRGADVNAQKGEYGKALQAASVNGHEKVVQILLDRGADVNAQGGRHGRALQAASIRGHEKIVQILLNHGADVNAQRGEYGTALQAASVKGHEKVVQILLDRGADINAQEGEYGTALQAATALGHKGIEQMLLRSLYPIAQEKRKIEQLRLAFLSDEAAGVKMLLSNTDEYSIADRLRMLGLPRSEFSSTTLADLVDNMGGDIFTYRNWSAKKAPTSILIEPDYRLRLDI